MLGMLNLFKCTFRSLNKPQSHSPETIRSFLSKARSLFERSSSRALTSKCSDEAQLLEFFINNDYDEQKALFKLEAELGLGVLESLEIRRIEDPSRIISAKGKVTKKNIPATNSWMAAPARLLSCRKWAQLARAAWSKATPPARSSGLSIPFRFAVA